MVQGKIPVSYTHLDVYKRQGTKAAAMDGQLTESQKAIRSDEMLALNEKHSREYEEAMLGRELEILLEEEIEMNGEQWYLCLLYTSRCV